MSVPFLSVKPRAIKLKVSPRFPAQLIGRAGIDVTKQDGKYYLDLDYNDFPTIGAVPAQATNALIFNPATGQYVQLPISLFGGGGSTGSTVYISDTPPVGAADNSVWWESDTGALYVRYNDGNTAQWVAAAPGSATDNSVWTQTTPPVTASSGVFTSASCAFRYKLIGKSCLFSFSVAMPNAGTAAGNILFDLPVTPQAVTAGGGKEIAAVGFQCNWQTFGTQMIIAKYDNTSIIGSGRTVVASGVFEIA